MMKHIVLLQFNESLTAQEIKEAFILLEGLGKTIPQIKSFKCGKSDSNEGMNHGFEYGFEIEFDNAEDRDIYLFHPDHVAVAGKVIPLLKNGTDSLMAFDYDPTKGL